MKENSPLSNREKLIGLLLLLDILLLFAALASRNEYVSLLLAFFIFISGAFILMSALKSIGQTIISKKWSKVVYEVVEENFTWEMPPAPGRHSKFITQFKIKYEYNGLSYIRSSSENLNLPDSQIFFTNGKAQEYLDSVKSYKYGKFAYVNPKSPQIAFLCSKVGWAKYGSLIFAMLLISLPIIMIFLSYTYEVQWR